ncbi:hypothetical protein MtrunA17_Chr6g0479401 [Medicago truncatula]|uniref:Transmembrane protein n=1 Tax=Medicago truncatula TaxID=3880 RepID=A0A396HGG7_MEDTR|nr:hypothetical protein MtrunA17_Chr6g0479401 [Medicago truncatula]
MYLCIKNLCVSDIRTRLIRGVYVLHNFGLMCIAHLLCGLYCSASWFSNLFCLASCIIALYTLVCFFKVLLQFVTFSEKGINMQISFQSSELLLMMALLFMSRPLPIPPIFLEVTPLALSSLGNK